MIIVPSSEQSGECAPKNMIALHSVGCLDVDGASKVCSSSESKRPRLLECRYNYWYGNGGMLCMCVEAERKGIYVATGRTLSI